LTRPLPEAQGVGIYSVPDAARLTGLSARTVRNWINGYSYTAQGSRREIRPVLERQLPILDDQTALGFLDLVEMRVISSLLKHHYSLQAIRVAHRNARELFNFEHPFALKRLKTGHKQGIAGIFTDMDDALVDVQKKQLALSIIAPMLEDLEFEDDVARRWWPLGDDHSVVIDPRKRFGQPVTYRESVPTRVLYDSYKVEKSVDSVADWYDVAPESVLGSIAFEERYAA
jgi:uncharacterized protein (DUF433 family)